MPALDTNVLVRFLVGDDPRQGEIATRYIRAAAPQDTLFISSTVALELEWVLRSRYKCDKTVVVGAFNSLLESREIEFQEEATVERALSLYAEHVADFADCMHLAVAVTHERLLLVTFDRKASRMEGMELLPG